MTIDELKELIYKGEKIDVEFKRSRNDITKDVYDSVCSFNNRNGGHIFLGVLDNKEILGVDSNAIDKMLKDFTTAINNANKIYPPLYLTPEVYEMESGKKLFTSECLKEVKSEDTTELSGIELMKVILILPKMKN